MRIGLDLDGVVADFEQHFLEYLNLPLYGAEGWDDPRFRDNFHLIDDDEHFWYTMPTIFKASHLAFTPEMYVTARPISNKVSRNWLSSHGFPMVPVITVGHNGSKVDVLKDKVDLFLDDGVHNFEELNAAGINCLLVTRNHNKGYNANGKRVKSLLDFQKQYLNGKL